VKQIRANLALLEVGEKNAIWPAREQALQVVLRIDRGRPRTSSRSKGENVEGDRLDNVNVLVK